MSRRARAILMAALLLRIADAGAQTAPAVPPVPVPMPEGTPDAMRGMAGGDLGFGKIGGDYYFRLNLGTELEFGKIALGIQVPLNFRLSNRCLPSPVPGGPEDCSLNTTLRKEDWDEVADYVRVVRYFRYGRPSDPFYARLGELHGATFGHGTILNSYYNAINLDTYKLGIQLNVNTLYGGAQTLMDNLVQPGLFGARLYVRPVSFWAPDSYANNLAVGLTLIGDAYAPVGQPQATRTSGHEPSMSNSAMGILGVDVEFAILRTKIIDVIPYSDVNHILGAGAGWHLGVLTKLRPLDRLGLNFRLEYRYLGSQYLPGYFDSHYDIQRYTFPIGCPVAKYDYVRGRIPDPRPASCPIVGLQGSGFYGEGVFSFFDLVTVLMAYEDAEGPNNSNLLLSLQLPAFEAVKLAAYYYKRFFDGISEAFSLNNAVLVAEARIRMYSILYFIARYARTWRLSADGATFDSTDDFSAGIGVHARF
jgi:hypothetical protein